MEGKQGPAFNALFMRVPRSFSFPGKLRWVTSLESYPVIKVCWRRCVHPHSVDYSLVCPFAFIEGNIVRITKRSPVKHVVSVVIFKSGSQMSLFPKAHLGNVVALMPAYDLKRGLFALPLRCCHGRCRSHEMLNVNNTCMGSRCGH